MIAPQTTVSAPLLMSTVGPVNVMAAPLPLEMMIPVSLTEIVAPVGVFSRMPPVGPGKSLIRIVFWPWVWRTKFGTAGGAASASPGTSAADPYQQPLQIG